MNRIKDKNVVSFVCLFVILFLSGCGLKVNTPSGFAKMKKPGIFFKYRAISSDEVAIAFKVRKNEPVGDVAFWSKIIKEKVPLIYGYSFVQEKDCVTGNNVKGKLLEFLVDNSDGKYTYLIGIFVKSKKIWIFESGGKKEAFETHRKDIVAMLQSVKL